MEDQGESLPNYVELADYRRSVAGLYAHARDAGLAPDIRWKRFRQEREQLFAAHPQSALTQEQKQGFRGLPYFDYDPAFRYVLPIDPLVESGIWGVELPAEGLMRLQRFGKIHFAVDGQPVSLTLFWVQAYGGGIFLPFRDATNQHETYGGGRYLLDTIKNADLGSTAQGLVVDFNFAYNPSCAYHPRWVCPLAPPENWLPVRIPAGEQAFSA